MHHYIYTSLLFSFLFLYSCNKESIDPISEKTVLVYLAANNNLANEALANLAQMEESLINKDGNLLVYIKTPNQNPILYKIDPYSKDITNKKKIIKKYDNHNTSDPNVLKQVITDVQTAYPAKQNGLVLWSHATGWIPEGVNAIKLKSFGEDNNVQMDIKDLKNAIPTKLNYILFDACSMASIEVLYELKDKAEFFIVSPAEVIAQGMPYRNITDKLLHFDKKSYIDIAQEYFNYYNAQAGLYRSATISVIDAAKLQLIAEETNIILNSFSSIYPDYNRTTLQRMDFDRYGNPLIAFDMLDFYEQNFTPIQIQNLKLKISDAVIYKANTPSFNGYRILKNSGLTCYVPTDKNEGYIHDYYRTLGWYHAAGIKRLF